MKLLKKDIMPSILWLALLMGAMSVSAQSTEGDEGSNLEFDQGETFNSNPIDVDGLFDYREEMEQRRKKNRQERDERREMARLQREENMARLQDRQSGLIEREQAKNEQRLQNKIGNIRVQNEKELLRKLFNEEKEDYSLTMPQSAPVVPATSVPMVAVMPTPPAAPAPQVQETISSPPSPQAGLGVNFNSSHFDGKDVDMNSNSGFSLTISRQVSDNFSIGFSGGIMSMSILVKDYASTRDALGSIDTDYQRLHGELNAKAFMSASPYFRPYLQFGVGYNRVSLSLDEEQVKNYKRGYSYYRRYRSDRRWRYNENDDNTEKISKYIVSGTAQLGVAFMFNQNLGLDIGAGYRYNFTRPFEDIKFDKDENREKEVLANLGSKLEKSHEVSFNAGFIVQF